MEEVDNIIIHSLRQIGCDIDEFVTDLSGFGTDLVVEATVKCLEIIRPGLGISKILPENMTARFRVGALLAQSCSDLGYRGDIGYQTFLYSSVSDLRRVFMFLIEKLPKECDKVANEPISKTDELEKAVASVVAQQLSKPWLPHYCHLGTSGGYTKVPYQTLDITFFSANEESECQTSVNERLPSRDLLIPSLLSRNARLANARPTNILERLDWLENRRLPEKSSKHDDFNNFRLMSRFSLNERIQEPIASSMSTGHGGETQKILNESVETSSTTIGPKEEEKAKVEKMKVDCQMTKSKVDAVQGQIKKLAIQLSQLNTTQQEDSRKLEALEEQKNIKAKTYNLLDDGDNNMKKLEAVIETESNKLINLANQWERHRAPLLNKYRNEREKYSAKASTSQKKLDELRQLREKERELIEECELKDQQYSQLVAEVQKLPRDVNRSAYTHRILEIINNVRKQKDEIDKILGDTRQIQKEINSLTGKLERSFTVVDELIFRDAKTNEASRKAYKLLATLHSDCNELVLLVEETGSTLREIRDLEEQIDSESTKNIEANLQRITADLEQMRHETASLTSQLAQKNL